jgi:hypothetical protein
MNDDADGSAHRLYYLLRNHADKILNFHRQHFFANRVFRHATSISEWLRLETKDGVVVAVTITAIYQRQFIACAIGVVVYVFLHPDLQFLQHFFNLRNLNIVSNDIVTGRLVSAIVEHAYPKDSSTRICWTI